MLNERSSSTVQRRRRILMLRNVETLYREYYRLTRVSRVSRVSRVPRVSRVRLRNPGGLSRGVSWNRQQVAEWSLTHNGIYTISARAPVYVRAYHEGLIASRRRRWPARRAKHTGTRVVLHPILYTVKHTDRIWLTGWATSMTSWMDCSKRCL